MITRTTASIPVDLKCPGQVFACMGFLEAADVLLGGIDAQFAWIESQATFVLCSDGDKNPFVVVLEFLAKAEVIELAPIGYVEGGAADGDDGDEDGTPSEAEDESDDNLGDVRGRAMTPAFPSGEGDRNALPIQLVDDGRRLSVSHWADGSSRNDFKLYSGNRSAHRIATQMLQGVRAKPKKNQSNGDLRNRGLQQLWQEQREALVEAPFDVLTPMGGSFNFDPRGAWTAIEAGYSPNTQKDGIAASPVVEILAAIGLENTRPVVVVTTDAGLRKTLYGKATYAVWSQSLPPMLARAALVNPAMNVPKRRFSFDLRASGKNKIVTFAQEEHQ